MIYQNAIASLHSAAPQLFVPSSQQNSVPEELPINVPSPAKTLELNIPNANKIKAVLITFFIIFKFN